MLKISNKTVCVLEPVMAREENKENGYIWSSDADEISGEEAV